MKTDINAILPRQPKYVVDDVVKVKGYEDEYIITFVAYGDGGIIYELCSESGMKKFYNEEDIIKEDPNIPM